MKKQILILVLFVLAAFANINKSYGQGPTALTPSPGTVYPYEITPTVVTTNGTFLWYVTTKPNLMDATGIVADDNTYFVRTGSAYNTTTGGTNTINLNWKPVSVGNTYYLVVLYTAESTNTNTPPTTCTVQNMKSYEIKPMNTLLLTVNLATSTGTDNSASPQICAPNITAAVVTPGAPSSVAYTFGTTTLYYNIKAEGMDGKWAPNVKLPVLGGNNQAYTDISWSSDAGTTWTPMTGFAAGGTAQTVTVADADATVAGLNYLVRVVINNAGYETLSNQAIDLTTDGFVTGTSPLLSDIVGGGNYAQALPYAKGATYTVTPRPTITAVPGAAGANFINKIP